MVDDLGKGGIPSPRRPEVYIYIRIFGNKILVRFAVDLCGDSTRSSELGDRGQLVVDVFW